MSSTPVTVGCSLCPIVFYLRDSNLVQRKGCSLTEHSDTRTAPYLQETMTDSLHLQRFNPTSAWFDARGSDTHAEEHQNSTGWSAHIQRLSSDGCQPSYYILNETLKSLHNQRLKGNYNVMKDVWAAHSTIYLSNVFLSLRFTLTTE